MLVRRTEDPAYWRTFQPGSEDLEYIYEMLIETGQPMVIDEIARAVVYRRVHQERERIERLLEKGRFYRPSNSYDEGEEVIFPALNFAIGTVVGQRDGHWPGHSPFRVISVNIDEEIREFAAEYDEPHCLNEAVTDVGEAGEGLSPRAIYERYGQGVADAVRDALRQNSDSGFTEFSGKWFLRGLMPDVHVGYLNLAEAVIEVAWEQALEAGEGQKPLSTGEILDQIEIEANSRDIAEFALERALSSDERFINIGSGNERAWLLRRLVPDYASEVPPRLRYEPIAFSMEAVPTESLSLVWGITDELSTLSSAAKIEVSNLDNVSFVLTYPHWRAGTLPLAGGIAALLPAAETGLSIVTLMDPENGERMTVWISHDHNYVSSLREWYDRHEIPSGAYLTLARTEDPNLFEISYQAKRRTQREYVRVAVPASGNLQFEIRRQPMSVEFDETMIMLDENSEAIDELWREANTSRKPMSGLLKVAFTELAKLSPQGTVHFNTLYTGINVLRRCPPEPILAELSLDWRYVGVGSGYYAMDDRASG